MNKADKDKVIAALEGALNNAIGHNWQYDIDECNEAITIMRGLAEDAEPPKTEKFPRVTQSIAETILGRGLDALSQGEQERMISAAQRRLDSVMTQLYTARLATSPQAAQTDEREAFEAWWDSGYTGCSNSGPWTHNTPIQWAWDAWRAGRKG